MRETTPKSRKKNDIFFLKNCSEDFLKMMPWAKKQETKVHSIVIKKKLLEAWFWENNKSKLLKGSRVFSAISSLKLT